MSVANAGSCKSGRFLVLDKPLLRFSDAAAACAKVGKKLATIDAVFGGSGTSPPPYLRHEHISKYGKSLFL